MIAGMFLSLVVGKNIREASLYGVAAGAVAVMTQGIKLCKNLIQIVFLAN